ncbi:hypothetical protein CALVIDRAFT_552667 [Calocera viscosa TUFC12733]|uniref:F-box domain-containing protein n=1 Tax=Calocera viscosa (strain TUFC12733) TaxID=1330018 RepID=A0A167QXK7_CALVF|nr:hypothetical protein CALVIDRAFT_552667 [Calocera viscosa TUFC12733]
MHRLWNIVEIVEEIVGWVGTMSEYPTRARRTYAALTKTARLFYFTARQHLWAEIDTAALHRLLNVHRVKSVPERVKSYTSFERHIRSITIDGDQHSLSCLIDAYIGMAALSPCGMVGSFAKLQKLVLDVVPEDEDTLQFCCHYAGYSLATLCLVPSLREIDLKFDVVYLHELVDQAVTFLQAIPTRCTDLTTLRIFTFTRSDWIGPSQVPEEIHVVVLDIIAQLPKLHTFHCGVWILCPNHFKSLTQHQTLKHLTIDDDCDFDEFPYECERAILQMRSAQSLRSGWFLPLRSLHLELSVTAITSILPDPRYKSDASGNIVDQMPLLETLSITSPFTMMEEEEEEYESVSLKYLIKRLRICRHVVNLSLDVAFEPAISDREILLLAKTWPDLQSLAIQSSYRSDRAHTNLTGLSLLHLASHCRSLTSVDLCFLRLRIVPLPKAIAPSFVLNKLRIRSATSTSSRFVDNFIRRLWPAAEVHLNEKCLNQDAENEVD